MKYTVKELLESMQFPEMKLICGRSGIRREIRDVKIIENKNIGNFLRDGELLLTSFMVYKNCSDEEFEAQLRVLEEKFVSGFIIKHRVENDPSGIKLEILKGFCAERDIPIIEVPTDTSFWGILRHVIDTIFDSEMARLKYFKAIHGNFTALSFLYNLSTCKEQEIVTALSNMLENPVSLHYSDYRCVASSDGDSSKLTIMENAEQYFPCSNANFSYVKQKKEWEQYIVQIDNINHTEAFLVITEKNRKLSELDYMAIENAIVSLQYSQVTDFAQKQIEQKYKKDIVHNLVHGILKEEEAITAAKMLGIEANASYRVVIFCTVPQNAEGTFTNEQLYETGVVENEINILIPTAHMYRNLNEVVMVQEVNPVQKETDYQKKIMELQETLQKGMVQRKKSLEFYIGIGNVVKGFRNLQLSYDYAKKALRYIDVIRQLYGNEKKSVVSFSNLGFFQIFGDMESHEDILKYVPETLQKVYRYDQEHHTELVNTLQVYLNNDRSIKKTAQDLFVHYRTISYRLDKILEISGMDFHNPHEMLAVRNGLIICKMAKKNEF